MPQSLADVVIHVVFSTKNRQPLITAGIREEMNRYMTGVLRNVGCNPIAMGGVEDHMHVLLALSRTMTIAQLVEKLKTSSNKWSHEKWSEGVEWQTGYGAFSVGRDQVTTVSNYIWNQVEHHRSVSFQDELRQILIEHGVEFDERYLWD